MANVQRVHGQRRNPKNPVSVDIIKPTPRTNFMVSSRNSELSWVMGLVLSESFRSNNVCA